MDEEGRKNLRRIGVDEGGNQDRRKADLAPRGRDARQDLSALCVVKPRPSLLDDDGVVSDDRIHYFSLETSPARRGAHVDEKGANGIASLSSGPVGNIDHRSITRKTLDISFHVAIIPSTRMLVPGLHDILADAVLDITRTGDDTGDDSGACLVQLFHLFGGGVESRGEGAGCEEQQ